MTRGIQNVNIRFNLNRELHRKAWECLRTLDRKRYRSYSEVVAIALTEYFDRQRRYRSEPNLERQEWEEQAVKRLMTYMEDSIQKSIPEAVGICLMRMFQTLPQNQSRPDNGGNAESGPENSADDLIDWGFLGG